MNEDSYDLILGYRDDVTEADVDFFLENPSRLDMLDSRETRTASKLWMLLAAAITMIFISKLLVHQYEDYLGWLLNEVLIDLLFEMGAALIGAVATVLFLRNRDLQQFRKNIALRQKIEQMMEDRMSQ